MNSRCVDDVIDEKWSHQLPPTRSTYHGRNTKYGSSATAYVRSTPNVHAGEKGKGNFR